MSVCRVSFLSYTGLGPIAEATMAMASGSSKSGAGREPADDEPAHVRDFRRDGYAVVRRVFDPAEITDLAAAFDRIRQDGLDHPRSFRHGNVFFRVAEDRRLGRVLRYVQWPSYFEPMLDRFRKDPRMLSIVEPLLGADLKQIINQLHWKPAGAAMAEFGYHQDICFRRPRSAYRDPAASYVQTGIRIAGRTALCSSTPAATAWASCRWARAGSWTGRSMRKTCGTSASIRRARAFSNWSRATSRWCFSTPCTAPARTGRPWSDVSTS